MTRRGAAVREADVDVVVVVARGANLAGQLP